MIRVGPAGWSYSDWEGVVYPQPRPPGFQHLAYLTGFVDCIELNSSFYGWPRPEHAMRWYRQASARQTFRFVAKLHRSFTHQTLGHGEDFASQRSAFLEGLRPLGTRLAALLVQFPHSFRDEPSARARLERISEAFHEFPLVLEVRHGSWFERAPLAWLQSTNFSLAGIDLPAAPDHPPGDMPTFGKIGYLRLHGRNRSGWFDPRAGRDQRYDYLYGLDEIEGLVQAARRIAAGADETYVVTNNHFSGKAMANAIDIMAALSGEAPLAPPSLVAHFPHLAKIARVVGQGALF